MTQPLPLCPALRFTSYFFPIWLWGGQVCSIIDLVHNHCLLAVCQVEHWHKARLQMDPKSLSTSSSTSSTGPRCRTFTYTEHLSNVHWQLANTEHLQQLLLSASSSNTHHRELKYAQFLTRTHAFIQPCVAETQSSFKKTLFGSRRFGSLQRLHVNKCTFPQWCQLFSAVVLAHFLIW